jgi:hypothetical protein
LRAHRQYAPSLITDGKHGLHHAFELDRNEFGEYAKFRQTVAEVAVEATLVQFEADPAAVAFLLVPAGQIADRVSA